MRKSPLGVAKWVAGCIKLALTHPQTDRSAKLNAAVWSILLLVVLMNITVSLLLGTADGFTLGFTAVGLIVYAACLRWAFRGLQYRSGVEDGLEA